MTQISMNKKYTTRNGLPVRILCVDRNYDYYKVCGLVTYGNWESLEVWNIEGKYESSGGESIHDLVEVKEKKKAYLIYKIMNDGCLVIKELEYNLHNAQLNLFKYKEELPEAKWFIQEIEYEV